MLLLGFVIKEEGLARTEIPDIPGLRRLEEPKESEEIIEVGPDEPRFASINIFNTLSQTRKKLDEDELEKLVNSMIRVDEHGQKRVKLIHPVTAGVFPSAEEAQAYMRRINATWHANHTIDELKATVEGGDQYLILIAGHRRLMAAPMAARKIGLNPDLLEIEVHLMYGEELTFRNAITTQYQENFHKRPESWEDAQAISAILGEGLDSGDFKTFKDCADSLGVTEERVSRANRFQGLPTSVKDLVAKDVLQFSRAVTLHELFAVLAYQASHEELDKATKEDLLAKISANRLYLPVIMEHIDEESEQALQVSFMHHASRVARLKNQHEVQVYVKELIESILNNGQLGFMLETEEQIRAEEKRKERFSDRRIAIDCIRAMDMVLQTERVRLATGETPAFVGSSKIRALLAVYHEGMEAIRNNEDPGIDIIKAGHALLAEIEASGAGDQVDSFTQSLTDENQEGLNI